MGTEAIKRAIKLLKSAHVSTDLIWERHDCVVGLEKFIKDKEMEKDFTQSLIDSMDKTTEDGFAEALLIAMSNLKDDQGRSLGWVLGEVQDAANFARQIAKMMLHKE